MSPSKKKPQKKKVTKKKIGKKRLNSKNSTSSAANKLPLPVIIAPDSLPLLDPNFSWEKFEKFSKDLIKLLHTDHQVHLVGVRGQKQYGIDLVAQNEDGSHFYAQNKRYKSFSVAQFKKAKEELKLKKQKTILLLACDASADLRLEVLGDKNWEIWDVTDISDKVCGLEEAEKYRLVKRHFGPEWAKAFTEYNEFSSLVTPIDFFRIYFDPKKLFNHTIPFIGRDDDLDFLKKFVRSNYQALILNAAGGIGKSRILWEFSKSCTDFGWDVLFIKEGIPPIAEHFQSINSDKVIFVFDDAHRFNVTSYLTFIYSLKIKFKIIFSTRPQGRERLKLDLRKNNLESSEIQDYEIKRFGIKDSKSLVSKILPQTDGQHLISLAKIVANSTLVGVLACNLIKRKSVFLASLASEEDIKDKVVLSFTDELAGNISSKLNNELIQKVLSYLSALAPISYKNKRVEPQFVAAIEEEHDLVEECIADLLHAGIVVDRGGRLRISPDVLSDSILERRCYLKNNVPSEFFNKLIEKVDGDLRNNLLKNISELDWRKKNAELTSSVLLKGFWNSFEDISSDNLSTLDWKLNIVKSIAYFQPIESYKVLLKAVEALSTKPEKDYRFNSCLKSIVDICRDIIIAGYNIEELMMILWQLGKKDERPLNPYPDHPIRRLSDLCSYERNFPVALYERTLNGLVAIINEYDSKVDFHDPISMLGGFLAKTSSSTISEGHSFTISPFHISYKNTKNLREKTFSVLKELANGNDLKSAYIAVNVISEASSSPRGMMGLDVNKNHMAVWADEIEQAIFLLKDVYKKTPFDLIKIHVKNKLNHKIRWSNRSKYKKGITKFLNDNPFTVAELKYSPFAYWTFNDLLVKRDYKDYKRSDEEAKKIFRKLALDIIAKLESPKNILEFTEEIVSELLIVKETVSSRAFSDVLSESINNELMCDAILVNNSDKIEHDFGVFLRKVSINDTVAALEYCKKAIELNNQCILRSIGESFWWVFEGKESDLNVLNAFSKFFKHKNEEVRLSSLYGFRTLIHQGYKDKTIRFLLEFDFTSKRAAFAFFDLLNPYCVRPEDLTDEQCSQIILKLKDIEDITDHGVEEFVVACAKRVPVELINLLVCRVEKSFKRRNSYTALPYAGFKNLDLNLSDSEMLSVFERISTALQKEDADTFWLPRLFYSLARKKIDLSISYLTSLIKSDDIEVVEIGLDLLQEYNHTIVFTKQDWVRDLLNHGKAKSTSFFDKIKRRLFRIGIPMSKQGTAGQPMPQDVALVENSIAAMSKATSDHERNFYMELKEYGEKEIAEDMIENQRFLESDE